MSKGENMVERCAAAINAAPFSYLAGSGHGPGECATCDEEREQARQLARAVIEALMEPTPAVVQTGAAEIRKFDRERDSSDEGAVSVFRAMLRTALSQPNDEGEGK